MNKEELRILLEAERQGPEPIVCPASVNENFLFFDAPEQREAELYWAAHESKYPSEPGDDAHGCGVYDSMEALVADLGISE